MYFRKVPQELVAYEMLVLHALEGSRCVHEEGFRCRLVRVVGVKTDEWGVYLNLEPIPAPGFVSDNLTPFKVDASWHVLWTTDRAVFAPVLTWKLLTRPDLVQEIETAASQGETGFDLFRHVHELAYGEAWDE